MTTASSDRHKTPRRIVTVNDDLWLPLADVVGDRGRAELIRQFLAWYLRQPGAKLPRRPPAKD